jgi:hypothetical protein
MNRGIQGTLVVLLGLSMPACGRTAPSAPVPPVLEGQRVMLVPVHASDPAGLDAELAHWLPVRAPGVEWVLPAELQAVMDRAPAWRVRLSAMPRSIAQRRSREPYLVDPTYGDLRRLGAIVDVGLAVLPVATRQLEGEGWRALELTVALVEIRGGRVVWLATVRADVPAVSPDGGAGAVAEVLARTLFPE